nr:hypothetical protein BCU62_02310 [Enterovibrio norvegicus]
MKHHDLSAIRLSGFYVIQMSDNGTPSFSLNELGADSDEQRNKLPLSFAFFYDNDVLEQLFVAMLY